MDGGVVYHPDTGTPQGGVISPLLANIYLHEALDKWWDREVLPRLGGEAFVIRYADDFVMVFSDRRDAERVRAVLPKRMQRFGLTVHPEKTRLVRFESPSAKGNGGKPGSFDFLGFTHYWGRSRKGEWAIKRKTAKGRFSRALRSINVWLRFVRHWPVDEQAAALGQKLRGHFNYYGLYGNSRAISNFHYEVICLWRKWLSRRSQKGWLTWGKFSRLLARNPLPPPRLKPGWRQLRLANP